MSNTLHIIITKVNWYKINHFPIRPVISCYIYTIVYANLYTSKLTWNIHHVQIVLKAKNMDFRSVLSCLHFPLWSHYIPIESSLNHRFPPNFPPIPIFTSEIAINHHFPQWNPPFLCKICPCQLRRSAMAQFSQLLTGVAEDSFVRRGQVLDDEMRAPGGWNHDWNHFWRRKKWDVMEIVWNKDML